MITCANAFNYNNKHSAYVTYYCYDSADARRMINILSETESNILHDIILGNNINPESKSVLSLIENGFVGIKDGKPSVLFPVLTVKELTETEKVLKPASDCAEAMFNALSNSAEQLARSCVPKNMKDTAGKAAYMGFMPCGLLMVYEQLKNKFALPLNSSIVGVIE